jgi:MFS family permease
LRNEANFPGAGEAGLRAEAGDETPRDLADLRGRPSGLLVSSAGYLSALIIGSFAGYLIGAWLADRIGRRNLFLIFSIGAIAIVLSYPTKLFG